MTLKVSTGTVSPRAIELSKVPERVQGFIRALIAENAACKDYFNHLDNRDPAVNGGKCSGDIDVHIYYAPASNGEYNSWNVLRLEKDGDRALEDWEKSGDGSIWGSGKCRIALRKRKVGHEWECEFYQADHSGASIGGVRDNSSYSYRQIDVS